MKSMLYGWTDGLKVPVLKVEKGKVEFVRDRIIHNAPLMYHWGAELSKYEYPVIVVCWRGTITPADLRTPVVYKGVAYDCSWASGSFIKTRKTYGFPVGFRPLPGVFTEEEQATKIGRALLPDAQFSLAGEFSIRTVENHSLLDGKHPIEDGNGYIREGALPSDWAENKITLAACKQNYQIWQALGTTEPNLYQKVLDEMQVYIREWWADWKQQSVTRRKAEGFRKELLDLNPELELHPYWVNPADESVSSLMRQCSTNPMLSQSMWLAVPAAKWTFPTGAGIGTRYPVASIKGSRVVDVDDDEITKSERERIARYKGALQVTLTTSSTDGYRSYKMILIVVPDEDWKDNCDIVTSVENLKLYRGKRDEHLGVSVQNGVLATLNVYDGDRLAGIPPDEFKEMAGDFDGDFIAWMPLDREKFANTIKAFKALPNLKGMKGKKTHNAIGDRGASEFLVNAMNANLGWATNARSASFAATNQQREELAKRLHAAGRIPYPETWSMDIWLTDMVQQVVDALKSHISMKLVMGVLGEYNGILTSIIPAYPAYLRWKRSDWAWKRGRPRLYSELSPELQALLRTDEDFAASEEMRSHIDDRTEGFAADIFRYNSSLKLDTGENVLEAAWNAVGMTVEPRPLCHFKDWAPPVEESDVECAKAFVTAFQSWNEDREAAKAAGIYVSNDLDDILEFNDEWRGTCASLTRKLFDGDSHRACYALWHLLHSKASKSSQAAAVFKGFPDICRGIVKKAASGRTQGAVKTILVGMAHNFSAVPETFSGHVEVRGREIHSVSGHPLLSGTLVAVVGDINPKNQKDGYSTPLSGKYVMEAIPFSSSGKVWTATLSPIVEL